MGIMAEARQPFPPLQLHVLSAPLKIVRKQDTTRTTVWLTAVTNTAVNIVMAPVPAVPVGHVQPPQHHRAHIMEEDTAVIKHFAGSLYFLA